MKGYPSLKWGQVGALQDYKGPRSFKDLKKFADTYLKPACSVDNLDLCDAEMKEKIKEWQAMDAKVLDDLIEALEVSIPIMQLN